MPKPISVKVSNNRYLNTVATMTAFQLPVCFFNSAYSCYGATKEQCLEKTMVFVEVALVVGLVLGVTIESSIHLLEYFSQDDINGQNLRKSCKCD